MLGSPFAAMGLANLAQQFGSGGDFEELSNCCYSPGLDDIPPLHRQQLEIAAGGLPAAAGLAGIGGYPGLSGSPALTQVRRDLHSICNRNFHFGIKGFLLIFQHLSPSVRSPVPWKHNNWSWVCVARFQHERD